MNAFVEYYTEKAKRMNDNAETTWIICYGDLATGMSFIGPFARREDALIHAHDNSLYMWSIAELDYPTTTEES